MEDHRLSLLHCLLLHGLISTLLVTTGLSQSDKKSYIVYLGNLPKGESSTTSLHNNMLQDVFGRLCLENSLNPKLVKGKIVVCDRLVSGSGPLAAGAIGALFQGIGPKDAAFSFPLPASHVDTVDGSRIFVYINSASNATTTIFKSDEGNDTLAPYVVSFSSRGPNPITPDILKVIDD
ncbi:hypothetical protein V6N12_003557 [Hibiscus sabdariffa]|uniref:Uncharacterized protein n=1 Tax=Hibiscus sabdariffa TaxID=183260 RepID=A0ABR2B498_9ROSI